MRRVPIITAATVLLLAGVIPVGSASAAPSANTTRYETTLVGNVETATVAGATTVYVHVTNSAAIKRDRAPKFIYQFKGIIVPVRIDTNTVVRRLANEDHVSMSTKGLASFTTIPLLAGDRITAKVRCTAVNPPDCLATRIDAMTVQPSEPKRYTLTLIGRVSAVTDIRTFTMRPAILQHGDGVKFTPAIIGSDVKVLGVNTTHVLVGTVKSTGTFAGITVGYLAVVDAKCVTPVAPATQWVCTASDVVAAPMS